MDLAYIYSFTYSDILAAYFVMVPAMSCYGPRQYVTEAQCFTFRSFALQTIRASRMVSTAVKQCCDEKYDKFSYSYIA